MRHRTIPALALLALAGSLAAGCSSSTATPSSAATVPSSPAAATSAAASAVTSAVASAAALPATDCAVIKPISAGAIATLVPIQSDSQTAAAAAMGKYLSQLDTALGQLTSAQAKTDLGAFISALSHASSTASQAQVTAALGKLGTDCP
jgi:flagellin-like hook-associated protein FlgL